MEYLSSMYIDNEMDLDEKKQFVEKSGLIRHSARKPWSCWNRNSCFGNSRFYPIRHLNQDGSHRSGMA